MQSLVGVWCWLPALLDWWQVRVHLILQPLLKAIELGADDASERNLAERYDLLISVISMNTSRLNEALQLNHYVLSQHPSYNPLLITRCAILIKLNRTDQFIRACEMAVYRNQGHLDAHYHLGIAYQKLGHLSHAEGSFKNMLVLDSTSNVARFHLASVLQASENTHQLSEARQL